MSCLRVDPALTEVVRHHLAAIAEEVALILWTTGRSPMLKTGDFVTVVADETGHVLGQGFGASFQAALMQDLVATVVQRHGPTLREGDALISNDPFSGMTHMPDIAVVAPAFSGRKLIGFCACYSHQSDIGGRFPGGFSSACTTSYEEGLRIPIVKLRSAGAMNEELFALFAANIRSPAEWRGDVEAKIAGTTRGAKALAELVARYGYEVFRDVSMRLLEQGESSARATISRIPDGAYHCAQVIETGLDGDAAAIRLELELRVTGNTATADFTGSSRQVANALNMPYGLTKAATVGALHAIMGADVTANSGFYRPIDVVAEPGSVVNPSFPAAVGGYTPLFFGVCDLVFRVMSNALPGRVPVPPEGGDVVHFAGETTGGKLFTMLDLFYGGWGGRPGKDGIDGVAPVYMGSYGSLGVEVIEQQYPVLVEGFGYVPDSGGVGRWRGSLAIFKSWRFLADGQVTVRTLRSRAQEGFEGGRCGESALTTLEREGVLTTIEPKTHVHLGVRAGDRLYHATSGAGGFGSPSARDPRDVERDIAEEKESSEHARRSYAYAPRRAT